MIRDFILLFERDLERLKNEIQLFEESKLWYIGGEVKNSGGNLALHLVGNLNTYVGKNLGGISYLRDRDAEFNSKNIPKAQLVEMILNTKGIISSSLKKLSEADLEILYPENVLGYEMTTNFFLIHLAAHLSYHLGQINYLRRLI